MKDLLIKFFKEEEGATIIEYIIMLAIITTIVMFAFPSIRRAIVKWITDAFSAGNAAETGAGNDYICPDGSTTKDLSTCK